MSALPHSRYDPVAVALHWAIALAIILMIPIGFFMEDFPISIRFETYNLHKSIGLTVLALSLFRLIWRLLNPPPALPVGMKPHERLLAHTAHWFLYFLMVAMPLSGWLMVSAEKKYPTVFFWLGEAPFLPMPKGMDPKATHEFFYYTHEYLAFGAIALIVLHVAAALKHHYLDKDTTLTRMLPVWITRKMRTPHA
jgi:cytochrome b561